MALFSVIKVLAILSIYSSGLISGQMLAIGISNYAALRLPESSWTLRFQVENALFTRTMPASLMTPIIGFIAMFVLEQGATRWMFAIACCLELVVLGITMTVNVPINIEVQKWTAGDAPTTWMTARDRWLRYHAVRTIAGLASFAMATIGVTSGISPN